jgi:hypothetical protein
MRQFGGGKESVRFSAASLRGLLWNEDLLVSPEKDLNGRKFQ